MCADLHGSIAYFLGASPPLTSFLVVLWLRSEVWSAAHALWCSAAVSAPLKAFRRQFGRVGCAPTPSCYNHRLVPTSRSVLDVPRHVLMPEYGLHVSEVNCLWLLSAVPVCAVSVLVLTAVQCLDRGCCWLCCFLYGVRAFHVRAVLSVKTCWQLQLRSGIVTTVQMKDQFL
jgi:hypothetical protein